MLIKSQKRSKTQKFRKTSEKIGKFRKKSEKIGKFRKKLENFGKNWTISEKIRKFQKFLEKNQYDLHLDEFFSEMWFLRFSM